MKEKIKKVFIYFIFPIILLVMIFSSIINIFQKEKPRKEELSDAKEQPHIAENQYFDPLRGRNLIIKSINTSASVVNIINDFLSKDL
jgi:uncharacterized membrane protein YfhO